MGHWDMLIMVQYLHYNILKLNNACHALMVCIQKNYLSDFLNSVATGYNGVWQTKIMRSSSNLSHL